MKTLLLALTVLQSLFATLDQKIFQSDITLSVSEMQSQPISYSGKFTMQGEKFLVDIFNIHAAYDGSTLYVFSPDDDELTLSRPTKQQLYENNPLLFAKAMADACNITERTNQDGSFTVVLTPKDRSLGIDRITVRLDAAKMPMSVEMKEGKKTTTLRFRNAKFIAKAPAFVLRPAVTTFVNDIR
ncbi:MAG: outer membrane lipoprotein carrier protein LolA [Paludibacteraceae bacterium]|nr:outer membrane lipoprotein carrier protein LolA [Paludibacteraceae bacterium]